MRLRTDAVLVVVRTIRHCAMGGPGRAGRGAEMEGQGMNYELIKTSAHDTRLDAGSVHMIITSPPYFGLRSYDGDQVVDWPAVEYAPMPGLPTITIPAQSCGLGEESTPEAYIGHMVLVMREMWRVLRDDSTAWVNLGDSFAGSGGAGGDYNAGGIREGQPKFKPPKSALRAKSKILIPHRFALAMQSEGWIVRQDIVWAKGVSCLPDYAGSCMPESTRDRPTTGHEYLFLLAKRGRYFYDAEAVKESSTGQNGAAADFKRTTKDHLLPGQSAIQHREEREPTTDNGTRNLRSVWVINPGSYPGAHFATFPERLPELCIQAGTSARGVCDACGAPWQRVVDKTFMPQPDVSQEKGVRGNGTQKPLDVTNHRDGYPRGTTAATTTGWRPTCTCNAGEPVPATVLDPFNGSGTSGAVATMHGRNYIGLDLSDDYFEQAHQRIGHTQPMFPGVLA